jgi:hypothetical protein
LSACVHDLQAQGRVGGQQLSHPPVIMRDGLNDPQLIGRDRSTELRRQLRAALPLPVSRI